MTFQSTCHGETTDKMTVFTGLSKGLKYKTLFSKYISITISMSQFQTKAVEQALLLPVFLCRCFDKKNQKLW
jgi:hypothetical protein